MLQEVLETLQPRDGAIYVDGTFGAGGYTRALLEAARCDVWAIDRDPDALAAGEPLAADANGRLRLRHGRFGQMDRLLAADGVRQVDGVALDLGVSSMQLDQPQRGFSFRADGPLDMRMDRDGPTAADVVNELAEEELAGILFRYGEERRSRRVARAIVAARADQPIRTTGQLADIVRRALGPNHDGIDPATRTFQALRIAVNEELDELRRGLGAAERLLAPGGRVAIVSFHSLEDRLVKDYLRERSDAAPRGSRHLPAEVRGAPRFRLLHRRALRPTEAEIAVNPRARSARLRAAERTATPLPSPEQRP